MEIIEPGTFVALSYDLFDLTDGKEELIHQVTPEKPETFIYGVTPGILEPLLEAVKGLEKGKDFVATLTPADGFGEYNNDLLRSEELPREMFETDGKIDEEQIFPGAQIYLQTNMGTEVPATVSGVGEKTVGVVVDLNHPLAGKTLKMRGKIEEVRPATEEEISIHTQPQGCGAECGEGCCGNCDCK